MLLIQHFYLFNTHIYVMPVAGVEPARPKRAQDFESSASANSATPAY